jgi:hypothetical protein
VTDGPGEGGDLEQVLSRLGLEVHARGDSKQRAKLTQIGKALHKAGLHFVRSDYRPDAISLYVTVPGQRWEVDVLDDGEVEVECFRSDGSILDEADLKRMIRSFAEPSA